MDISSCFSEFEPTSKQIRIIEKTVKKGNKWWGTNYDEIEIQKIALMIAPGELANLTPAALDLLRRCENRTWAFYRGTGNIRHREYGYPYKGTFGDLADLLLSLDLIYEANSRQKLAGNSTLKELHELLHDRGANTRGKKDELVDRILNSLTDLEINNLIGGVFLYITTEKGNIALSFLEKHIAKVRDAFFEAVRNLNSSLIEARPTPPDILPEELTEILSQEDWDSLAAGDHIETNQKSNFIDLQTIDRREQVNLSMEAIQKIVDKISAHKNGFLTIATTFDEDSPFVQTCFDREGTFFIDSNCESEKLKNLGFKKSKDDFLPCKYVSEKDVTIALLETLQVAFGMKLGQAIEFNYEYID